MMNAKMSRRAPLAVLLLLGTMLGTAQASTLELMPMPASVQQADGTLPVGNGIAIVWQGVRSPLLDRTTARFAGGMERLGGVVQAMPDASPATLTIVCNAPDAGFLTVGERQHYRLTVDAAGIRLEADGPAGVLEGFSTLLQLAQHGHAGMAFPYVTIDDAPRFIWRGLMIDVARHFMTIPTLERQIDAMERVKLDVLHLHLSDAQGWRVESKLFPLLQKIGSHGQYYTQAEIKGVIAYAGDRGIRVVPEIDLPGHALALLQAYPAMSATPPDKLPKDMNPDQAAIDPTNPKAVAMVSRVYGELAGLFPDKYFHAGGDEVEGTQWTDVPRIAASMQKRGIATPEILQAQFTATVQRVLAAHGKTMIGWDEVIAAPIPSSVAIQVWRSSKWIEAAAKAGHPVIVSAGYYLDLMQPSDQHYAVDPLDARAVGTSLDDARKLAATTQKKAVDFARDDTATMTPADEAHVLGGEAALWTEIVSDEMLDARLWPRTAAIAERFWSRRDVRDPADMYRRLSATEDRLGALGLDDQSSRTRMTERLAPGRSTPIAILLDAVAPARNYTLHEGELRDRTGMHPLALNGLADIATPDDMPGRRLASLVQRFLGGDHSVEPALRVTLTQWQDNDAAFALISAGNATLEMARPLSRDLQAFGTAGLHALDMLDGRDRGTGGFEEADAAISRQSSAMAASVMRPDDLKNSPVAGLLMPVVEPVGALVTAAKRVQAPTTK